MYFLDNKRCYSSSLGCFGTSEMCPQKVLKSYKSQGFMIDIGIYLSLNDVHVNDLSPTDLG